jgi:NADH-quinone oxidoreductase subunit H
MEPGQQLRLPYLLPAPDWMPEFLIAPLVAGYSIADFAGMFMLLNFILFFVMFEIWLERKVGGHIQLRRGPLHVGPHGSLQSPADVIKLLIKEDLTPATADKRVFKMAPYLIFVPVFLTFLVIPWGGLWPFNLTLRPFDLSLIYIVAVPSIQGLGMVVAGWSSGNKYSLLGAARVVAQFISYELPMVVTLLAIGILSESLSIAQAVETQRASTWFVFLQPVGFFIFIITMMSEMHRTPFDIAVAESEIVGGPFIEYSGMRWGMFFLAEFAAVFLNSCLATALFLGGPELFPFAERLPIPAIPVPGLPSDVTLFRQIGDTIGVFFFFGKAMTLMVLVQWARFALPRIRIDQLMDLAWKFLLPVSFANLILTAVYSQFGFVPFGIGLGLVLLVLGIVLASYRGRANRETGIRLVTVPRTGPPSAASIPSPVSVGTPAAS